MGTRAESGHERHRQSDWGGEAALGMSPERGLTGAGRMDSTIRGPCTWGSHLRRAVL